MATKVFVIMGNDFPDAVFSQEPDAAAYVARLNSTAAIQGYARIYWRHYEFPLDDKRAAGGDAEAPSALVEVLTLIKTPAMGKTEAIIGSLDQGRGDYHQNLDTIAAALNAMTDGGTIADPVVEQLHPLFADLRPDQLLTFVRVIKAGC